MVSGVAKGDEEVGYVNLGGPVDPDVLAALAEDMAPLGSSTPIANYTSGQPVAAAGAVPTRADVLTELYFIKVSIRTWFDKQPDQVLREASAYSARLTELWTELRLLEGNDRRYTQLRTMQVTPILEEIDRQVGFQRSRIAMMRQDLDMTRGT